MTLTFEYCSGFCDFAAGLSVGFCGLAAGFAIGVVGDAGVRGLKLILFKNLTIYNVEYIWLQFYFIICGCYQLGTL